MKAAILAIGDEMTSGQRLDTNSQWLSQQLGELGIEVHLHATAADDLAAIVDLFHYASSRADIVVATGGLGPTADDLTRDALAVLLGRPLEMVPEALAHIEQLFAARGRPMPERNRLQALIPAGSRLIENPHGTAPGIHSEVLRSEEENCHLFALPGVPAEMFEMWHASVAPTIAGLCRTPEVLRHRVVKLFGPGESQLEAMLPEMIARDRSPKVGITASLATLSLRITAQAPDEASCQAQIAATVDEIYAVAGKFVFGEGEVDLDHVLMNLLGERHATLATCESFTGGQLAVWFSAIDPHRAVYRGGTVRGTDEECAPLENAQRIRQELGATFGLVVGRETEQEVEVAWHDGTSGELLRVGRGGHPAVEVARVAKSAINLLRRHLVEVDRQR